MSDSATAARIEDQGERPRRGRPRGSKNKRTVEVARLMGPLAPKARATLLRLMQADDPELALRSAQLTLAYLFGRPTERKEVATDATVQTDTRNVNVDATGVALRLAHSLGMPIKLGAADVHVPAELAEEIPAPALAGEPVEIPDNGHHAPDVEIARRISFLVANAGTELSERLGLGPKLETPPHAEPDHATQDVPAEPQQADAATPEPASGDPVGSTSIADPVPLMTIQQCGNGWMVGGRAMVLPTGDGFEITGVHGGTRRVLVEMNDSALALRRARELVALGEFDL